MKSIMKHKSSGFRSMPDYLDRQGAVDEAVKVLTHADRIRKDAPLMAAVAKQMKAMHEIVGKATGKVDKP